jgi:uncharacterized protein YecE (DUF72 family)
VKPPLPRFGTQAWTMVSDWEGVFYPPGTSSEQALGFYAQALNTVEVNATFHAVPQVQYVDNWRKRTPDDFVFAVKMPQAITHEASLDLSQCEPVLARFLEATRHLESKLGPILIQLPPSFVRTPATRLALAAFLDRLAPHNLRLALEVRHASWQDPAVERALADRNVAWVLTEGGANSKVLMFTAGFIYIRWGRSGHHFENFGHIVLDRSDDLDWWAETIKSFPADHGPVYGYMSDEFAGHAPGSIRQLQARLDIEPVDPLSLWPQKPLF